MCILRAAVWEICREKSGQERAVGTGLCLNRASSFSDGEISAGGNEQSKDGEHCSDRFCFAQYHAELMRSGFAAGHMRR